MKKIISIVTAGLAALAAFVSCVKEPFAVFDASKATAPVPCGAFPRKTWMN